MKEKNQEKIFLLSLFLLIFIILPVFSIEAKSGCCSHHGGVCGCQCCDGTSLSATCAPYYPQCSSPTVQPEEQPTQITPQPLDMPSSQPEQEPAQTIQEPLSTESSQTEQVKSSQTENYSIDQNQLTAELPKEGNRGSAWLWIIGLGVLGYIFYRLIKKKK